MQLLLGLLLCLTWCQVKSDRLEDSIPGDPGLDYPLFASIPRTEFQCVDKGPGYYADIQARCQVFHVCHDARKSSFLCPNGTLFNQKFFVCDWWFNVDCEHAPSLYPLNQNLFLPKVTPNAPQGTHTPTFERFRTAPPSSSAPRRDFQHETPQARVTTTLPTTTTITTTAVPIREVSPSRKPTYFEPTEIPVTTFDSDEFNPFTSPRHSARIQFKEFEIQTKPAPTVEPVSFFSMIADLGSTRSTLPARDKWIFLVNDPNMIANLEDAARRFQASTPTPAPPPSPTTTLVSRYGPSVIIASAHNNEHLTPPAKQSSPEVAIPQQGWLFQSIPTLQNNINNPSATPPSPTTSIQLSPTFLAGPNRISQDSSTVYANPTFQPSPTLSSPPFVLSGLPNHGFQPSFPAASPLNYNPSPVGIRYYSSPQTTPQTGSSSFAPTSQVILGSHPSQAVPRVPNNQYLEFNPTYANPPFHPSPTVGFQTSSNGPRTTFQPLQKTPHNPQTSTIKDRLPFQPSPFPSRPQMFPMSYGNPTSISSPGPTVASNRPFAPTSQPRGRGLYTNGARSPPMTQLMPQASPSPSVLNPSSHVHSFFSLPDVAPNPSNVFTNSDQSPRYGNVMQSQSAIPRVPTAPSPPTTTSTTTTQPPPATTTTATSKPRQVWALDSNSFWPTTNILQPSAVPRKWDVSSTHGESFSPPLITPHRLSFF